MSGTFVYEEGRKNVNTINRIFVVLCVVMFAAILTPAAQGQANEVTVSKKGFYDVSIYHWAKPNIDHLVTLGAIDGFDDGTFGVGVNVTRAQASKIVVESLKIELVKSDEQKFTDVPKSHWAKHYIETLSAKGIIDGFENGTFQPDATLTRSQMAKILSNSFELTQLASKPFADVSSEHWAYNYIMALLASGMTTGYSDNTYRPDNAVTREEMAVFVSRGIAKGEGIVIPAPLKKPANQTNLYPEYRAMNEPIRLVPSKAVLREYDRTFHYYQYEAALPDGGTISEVRLNAQTSKKIVNVIGTDKNGNSFVGIYYAEDMDMMYSNKLPNLTDDGFNTVSDLAREFAEAYGWIDVYNMIEMHIFFDGNTQMFFGNINTKTLGKLFDEVNEYWEWPLITHEVDGERVLYSFAGIENNAEYEWRIMSDSCENGVCPDDIDAIKLDRDRIFYIDFLKKPSAKMD